MKKYIKADLDSGCIGLWWIFEDDVIGRIVPLDDGEDDRGFVQYSLTKNHMTEWKSIINEQLPEHIELIPKGYRCIERGRVVYNIRAHVYEIICSKDVAEDPKQIQMIVDTFGLNNVRYDVLDDPHYRIVTYTGNPAIDNFEF